MDTDSEDLDARESKKVELSQDRFEKVVAESQWRLALNRLGEPPWPEYLRLSAVELVMEDPG